MSKTVECPACSKVIALKGVPAHTRKCREWDSKIGITVSEYNFDHHYKRGLYADDQVEGVDYCECLACLEINKVHRLKRMSQHLKKVHRMSVDEYLGKYPKGRVRLQSTLDRRVATTLDKYGVENVFQSEDIKRKSVETMMDRYGVSHNTHVESARNKRARTNLRKYGHENVFGNSDVQEKRRQSMLRNHGVVYPQQSPEIRARTITTNMERYGSAHYFTCDIFVMVQEFERFEREKKRREDLKASGKYEICPHCDEIFSSLTSRHKAICLGWPDTVIPEPCLCEHVYLFDSNEAA